MRSLVGERPLPFEQFPALENLPMIRHAFTNRVPAIEVTQDKAEALRRLDSVHRDVRTHLALDAVPFQTAEQIHGNEVAVIDSPVEADQCFTGCDGIVTNQSNLTIGIYVADCCAVYLVDPVHRAIGLVHSGKKGTELGIVPKAIRTMMDRFDSRPEDCVVQLSPCIRPLHYEIDFAQEIVRQCHSLGVLDVHDSGRCTACDLERYYSYRAEQGKTGRMLALLALR